MCFYTVRKAIWWHFWFCNFAMYCPTMYALSVCQGIGWQIPQFVTVDAAPCHMTVLVNPFTCVQWTFIFVLSILAVISPFNFAFEIVEDIDFYHSISYTFPIIVPLKNGKEQRLDCIAYFTESFSVHNECSPKSDEGRTYWWVLKRATRKDVKEELIPLLATATSINWFPFRSLWMWDS